MKKKRIIFITLGVIIALTIGHFALSKPIYTLGAKIYLANKYSWNIKDIETVKYQRDYFDSDFGFMFLDSSNSISYNHKKWIFRYKKRDFNVERYHLHYADDYQLEDIFKWCTEYLQENVDKDITGVEVYSDIIYHSSEYSFDYKLPWNYRKIFTKEDAEKLLLVQKTASRLNVFYYKSDFTDYGKKDGNGYNHKKYLPNDNYFRFKNIKTNKLYSYNYINCNIVIISRNTFSREHYSSFIGRCRQTKITFSQKAETNYIYSKYSR